jgi:hypothetical protein
MSHFLLVLQYLLTGNPGSMGRMAVGTLFAWFFLCDYWVLKFFPETRWWTENMDQFGFMVAASLILAAELGRFFYAYEASRPPTTIRFVLPGESFNRRDWTRMIGAIATQPARPPVIRRFFAWQAALLRPRWLRMLWRFADSPACPAGLAVYLRSHENRGISRRGLLGTWWSRPWRWILWLWLPGLCVFLAFSSLPSLVIEKIDQAMMHEPAESCAPRIWAIDIKGYAIPQTGPMTPLTLGLKLVPGTPPVFVIPPGLGPTPVVLHLDAEDLPRSGRRVLGLCLADEMGSKSLTCTFSVPGSAGKLSGTSHSDLRGQHAQFEIRRVQQNNTVLPLKLSFTLQRRDGIGIGDAIVQ